MCPPARLRIINDTTDRDFSAVPGRDEPAVHARGERFVTPRKVAASDANRGAPALSALSLGKRFGDRVAFDDVSFEIGCGERGLFRSGYLSVIVDER